MIRAKPMNGLANIMAGDPSRRAIEPTDDSQRRLRRVRPMRQVRVLTLPPRMDVTVESDCGTVHVDLDVLGIKDRVALECIFDRLFDVAGLDLDATWMSFVTP